MLRKLKKPILYATAVAVVSASLLANPSQNLHAEEIDGSQVQTETLATPAPVATETPVETVAPVAAPAALAAPAAKTIFFIDESTVPANAITLGVPGSGALVQQDNFDSLFESKDFQEINDAFFVLVSDITITKPITINKPGAMVTFASYDKEPKKIKLETNAIVQRHFILNGANIILDLGNQDDKNKGKGNIILESTGAGGILVDQRADNAIIGNMTISGLSGNANPNGGAIDNRANNLTVINPTLTGNTADFGGAIHTEGSITIKGGTISGNTANEAGGAIFITVNEDETYLDQLKKVTVEGTTFSDNEAGSGIPWTLNTSSTTELTRQYSELHASNVKTASFSAPFTNAYNNYDIAFDRSQGDKVGANITVVDSVTKFPIAGATIIIDDKTETTDATGSKKIASALFKGSEHSVGASAANYLEEIGTATIGLDETEYTHTFELERDWADEAIVYGTVTLKDAQATRALGDPIPAANFTFKIGSDNVTTNANGQYMYIREIDPATQSTYTISGLSTVVGTKTYKASDTSTGGIAHQEYTKKDIVLDEVVATTPTASPAPSTAPAVTPAPPAAPVLTGGNETNERNTADNDANAGVDRSTIRQGDETFLVQPSATVPGAVDILAEDGTPLGTINVPEGQTIEDVDIADELVALGAIKNTKPASLSRTGKANPKTGAAQTAPWAMIATIGAALAILTKKSSKSSQK